MSRQHKKPAQPANTKKGFKTYIPKGIAEKLFTITESPFEGYNGDYSLYLINLICSQSARSKQQSAFVQLHSPILKKYIWNYQKYLAFLEGERMIAIDHRCYEGKSKGYVIAPEFFPFELIEVTIFHRKLKKHHSNHIIDSKAFRKYPWVPNTLKGLVVNPEADQFLQLDKQRKINAEAPIEKKKQRSKSQPWLMQEVSKDPHSQFNHAMANLAFLKQKSIFLKLDKNERLHHNLTNCYGPLRDFISHRDGLLACVDITNCQPFLLAQICRQSFWKKGSQGITFYNLSKDIRERYSFSGLLSSNIIKCVNLKALLAEISDSEELVEFLEVTRIGIFYNVLQAKLQKTGRTFSRQEAKDMTWEILYSSPEAKKKGKKEFRQAFPLISQLAATLQLGSEKALPSLLQALESKVMLGVIMTSINKERPELPLLSIHDSIVTLASEISYVESIFQREFTFALGTAPTVSSKIWLTENASFKDGVNYYNYLKQLNDKY